MKTPEAVRDEAAYDYAFQPGLVVFNGSVEPIETAFKSGYEYAVKNDPRVLALVEALKYSAEGLKMWRKYQSPGNVAEVETTISDALKAWESEP
jgi:hypothetical protein